MLNPLAEYLLATSHPDTKQPLCRLGVVQMYIPIFPPGFTLRINTLPEFGNYALVFCALGFSETMVPGSFSWSGYHAGSELAIGQFGALAQGRFNFWVEITRASPLISDYTNISGMNQFVDAIMGFLIIDSSAELDLLHEHIRVFGGMNGEEQRRLRG